MIDLGIFRAYGMYIRALITLAISQVNDLYVVIDVLNLVSSIMTPIDILMDILTVVHYYQKWEAGQLHCAFWHFGLFFLFFPTQNSILYWGILKLRGKADWKQFLFFGLGYFFYVPWRSIKHSFKTVFGHVTEEERAFSSRLAGLKLFQVAFGTYPQVAVSWSYQLKMGLPWQGGHWVPFLSNISSSVMIIFYFFCAFRALWKRGSEPNDPSPV